jgi:oxaloacetate decarboxylase gamma subunit
MEIIEGLRLRGIGMGVVFAFLLILVWAMQLSALFFLRFKHLFPEAVTPSAGLERRGADDSDVAVAIAAVKAYTKG